MLTVKSTTGRNLTVLFLSLGSRQRARVAEGLFDGNPCTPAAAAVPTCPAAGHAIASAPDAAVQVDRAAHIAVGDSSEENITGPPAPASTGVGHGGICPRTAADVNRAAEFETLANEENRRRSPATQSAIGESEAAGAAGAAERSSTRPRAATADEWLILSQEGSHAILPRSATCCPARTAIDQRDIRDNGGISALAARNDSAAATTTTAAEVAIADHAAAGNVAVRDDVSIDGAGTGRANDQRGIAAYVRQCSAGRKVK